MSILNLMSRKATIVHRGYDPDVINEYGDEIPVDSETETVCEVQQQRASEPGMEGEFSSEDWIGFFPITIGMNTGDAVTVAGVGTFEVVGDPWYADTGTVQVHHVEVNLRQAGDQTPEGVSSAS